ncbi:UNVERIFIED_CONTAM: hypothetical protein FKN15_032823 [Acipenser sinensis]
MHLSGSLQASPQAPGQTTGVAVEQFNIFRNCVIMQCKVMKDIFSSQLHDAKMETCFSCKFQIKTAKCEKEMQLLQLQSLQYLERYIYLLLFNTYLHLEKKDSWQRPFSIWMYEVAARAGVYEILNELGFSEFENPENTQLARLRYRWQQQSLHTLPFRGEFI